MQKRKRVYLSSEINIKIFSKIAIINKKKNLSVKLAGNSVKLIGNSFNFMQFFIDNI